MSKTITTISLDHEVKENAHEIFKKKGLTLSEEINNFLKEIIKKEEGTS